MNNNQYDPSRFDSLPEEAKTEFELAYISDLLEMENYDAALDWACQHHEYYGVVEPPVRRRRSHGSGRSEPAVLCRERLFI